jgi:hypothetical protein
VVLDRPFRGAKGVGDLFVAVAAGHEADHFQFARGQLLDGCRAGRRRTGGAEQTLRDGRLKYRPAAMARIAVMSC